MKRPVRTLTRRDFIWRVARHGSAAALGSMFALDLLARDDRIGRPHLEGRAPATRRRVIILGAGMAGLSTAYELGALGYECIVLEARRRPGGRCWTVRRGTEETELGGERQICRFDEGLFFNAGPMRISHHHESTLAYCREFGISLVAFPNLNEAAYVHREGFPKLRFREVRSDWRGFTAELLAKSIKKTALDAPLTANDRDRIIEYLREEGRLDTDLIYKGGTAISGDPSEPDVPRGYAPSPGAGDQPGVATKPLDVEMLVKAGYPLSLVPGQAFNQQPTMLTPPGGMDRLANGFAEKLGPVIRMGAEVREIHRTTQGGVTIRYVDARSGSDTQLTGDFCVCTLPPAVLARLPSDFSKATVRALTLAHHAAAGKIGLQFKRRFWEEDDGIYGGLSLTNLPISQIAYPFDNYGSSGKGVIIGYYHFGNAKAQLDDQPFPERERRALEQGEKIHPQYPAEFENSFSVAWHRVPRSEMAWTEWSSEAEFTETQRALGPGDGPFYFAGDWVSHINGWQAGAFTAAHRVCGQLHTRALASG